MSSSRQHPRSAVIRRQNITTLSQRLKKERDFAQWQARRSQDYDPEAHRAWKKASEIIEKLRQDVLAGVFDDRPAPRRLDIAEGEL